MSSHHDRFILGWNNTERVKLKLSVFVLSPQYAKQRLCVKGDGEGLITLVECHIELRGTDQINVEGEKMESEQKGWVHDRYYGCHFGSRHDTKRGARHMPLTDCIAYLPLSSTILL